MERAMLKVKSASSAIGGSGSTTMARAASTPTGRPRPGRSMARSGGVAGAEVAVAMALVPRCVDRGVECGRRGRRCVATAGRAQLIDVGQDLGHRDIQRRWDLFADVDACMQSTCK